MKPRLARLAILASPLAFLVLRASPVIAQPPPAQPDSTAGSAAAAAPQTPSSAPGQGATLQQITVTATRRRESIERVPLSVAALSQRQMVDLGITDIAQIAAATPGLQYAVPNGYSSMITTLSIRGMNTQVGADVVGIYLDDTPIQSRIPAYGNIGSPIPLTWDMERVEVLRGPQGTLFGAGAEAGAVRFIPTEPSVSTYTGLAQAGFAFTQNGAPSYEVGVASGGPIIDQKVGFRVSFWNQQDGGYVDRVDPLTGVRTERNANTNVKSSARIALAIEPMDGLRITPSVYYQQTHQDDSGRFFDNDSDPSRGILLNATFTPEVSTDQLVMPTLKLQYGLPFADLTVDSSYTHRTIHLTADASVFYGAFFAPTGFGSPVGPSTPVAADDFSPMLIFGKLEAITEEARLTSKRPSFITWVTGIFFDHRKQQEGQASATDAFGDPSYDGYFINGRMTDDQYAAYAQADFHITQKFTATLGERVAHVIAKEIDQNGDGVLQAGEPPVGSTEESETPNTQRVALTYQLDSAHMVYAAVSKGFRVGGGNAPVADYCGFQTPSYKSDYDWSDEVGTKDQFLSGHVQVDASAFHVMWYRVQEVVIPACGSPFATNTGNAEFNGFDIQSQAIITDKLRTSLALGYVNAYFPDSYYIAPGVPLVLAGDKVGQLPQVNPPWHVDFGVDYIVPTGGGDLIRFHAEDQFRSRNPGPFITQIPTSPDYYNLIVADPSINLVNGRIAYEAAQLTLSAYVNNLTNTHPKLASFQYPVTSNIVTYSTFQPRTVGLEATYSLR